MLSSVAMVYFAKLVVSCDFSGYMRLSDFVVQCRVLVLQFRERACDFSGYMRYSGLVIKCKKFLSSCLGEYPYQKCFVLVRGGFSDYCLLCCHLFQLFRYRCQEFPCVCTLEYNSDWSWK